jgi:hypothetical protein
LQEEQVPAEHELHPLLPPTGAASPPEPFANAEKQDNTRLAPLLQPGHCASSSARLIGRSISNLSPQAGQQYS